MSRCLQCAMPAPQYDRAPFPDLSMGAVASAAMERAANPPARGIHLMDVVRPTGERRRGIVVDAIPLIPSGAFRYSVMFRDGTMAEYPADELVYVAPALG